MQHRLCKKCDFSYHLASNTFSLVFVWTRTELSKRCVDVNLFENTGKTSVVMWTTS